MIACDQFTSQPEYWEQAREIALAKNLPSAYSLILPEALLQGKGREDFAHINSMMHDYLEQNIFTEYKDAYIYVERTLLDGSIRPGLVGVIDLEEYDYQPGTSPQIRATELTVTERIPPRKAIRDNAELELSHVILLCDDERRELIEAFKLSKHSMKKLYDFELMLGGGRIQGWLVQGDHARAFNTRLASYIKRKSRELSLVFAVGDGNHSLAAAKACWNEQRETNQLARYAMVELENIHDPSLKFEPIHRIVKGVNPDEFIAAVKNDICAGIFGSSWPITYYAQGKKGTLHIDRSKGASALIVLQKYLDEKEYAIDYIHDTDALVKLSAEDGCVGLEMPPFDAKAKSDFFRVISDSGVLPRKTFSMGHAQEKRYYLEARKIR
ncbi:MAG: DUF1015 domain-containing protein [Synergistaceae bacterium]|nr:DUF1015 domain-containing protein [Synergistaceae bacterium]